MSTVYRIRADIRAARPSLIGDNNEVEEIIHGHPCGHVISGMEIDLRRTRIKWPGKSSYGQLEFPFEILVREEMRQLIEASGQTGFECVPIESDPTIFHLSVVGRRRIDMKRTGLTYGNPCPYCGRSAIHKDEDAPFYFLDQDYDVFKAYPYCYSIFLSESAAEFFGKHMPKLRLSEEGRP